MTETKKGKSDDDDGGGGDDDDGDNNNHLKITHKISEQHTVKARS
jgi:hypothetical protein